MVRRSSRSALLAGPPGRRRYLTSRLRTRTAWDEFVDDSWTSQAHPRILSRTSTAFPRPSMLIRLTIVVLVLTSAAYPQDRRSEERRVGKECRSGCGPDQ